MTRSAAVRRSALLLLAALLLAGCGLIDGLLDTERALQDAGHTDATVDISDSSSGPGPLMTVSWVSSAETLPGYVQEIDSIKRIVWTTAPLRFTLLRLEPVNVGGFRYVVTFTRDELQQEFGPRPPGLKEQDVEDVGRDVLRGVVIVLVAGFLVLAAIVLTIVLVVRRNRRNRAQQAYAGGWAPPPGSPMWGQPAQPGAWGQQPWGQPPPPGSWGQPPPPPQDQWGRPPMPPGDPDDPWKQPPPS